MKLLLKTLLPIVVLLAGGVVFFMLSSARKLPSTRPPVRELPAIRALKLEARDHLGLGLLGQRRLLRQG